MLFKEIIAVYSENNTKTMHALCGQNVELLTVKEVVHIVTTERKGLSLKVEVSGWRPNG
jgi:hypothetical protein